MILAALALAAGSPSFDCRKALGAVEKMICVDERLAAADRALGILDRTLPPPERQIARDGRFGWLRERNRCRTKACIIQSYESALIEPFEHAPRAKIRTYKMKGNPSGTLEILDIGDGWLAFFAQADWTGVLPISAPDETADETEIAGVFKLERGSRAPTDEFECGWKIQRLRGDRWKLEDWPGSKDLSCGARNASVAGVYSR